MPYAVNVWPKDLVCLIFQSLIFSYLISRDHEVLLNISMYHFSPKYKFSVPLFHILYLFRIPKAHTRASK